MATYLDAILAAHRAAAAGRSDTGWLREAAASLSEPVRGFRAGLGAARTAGVLGVVAELKRRTPSQGVLGMDLDAGCVAAEYETGGATCLSVLTDAAFFGGSPEDLRRARSASSLPVLRKDFTVCDADVYEARLMGADAVLLIVAALDQAELVALMAAARQVGLDALVEVHDTTELARALDAGTTLVGVNQRDLATFMVDSERAVRVAESIPPGVVAVAESGVHGSDDARRLADAGYDAVLVGEHLVRSPDRKTAVAALRVPAGDRPRAGVRAP